MDWLKLMSGRVGGREIKMKMEMMMMTISFDDLYFIV